MFSYFTFTHSPSKRSFLLWNTLLQTKKYASKLVHYFVLTYKLTYCSNSRHCSFILAKEKISAVCKLDSNSTDFGIGLNLLKTYRSPIERGLKICFSALRQTPFPRPSMTCNIYLEYKCTKSNGEYTAVEIDRFTQTSKVNQSGQKKKDEWFFKGVTQRRKSALKKALC